MSWGKNPHLPTLGIEPATHAQGEVFSATGAQKARCGFELPSRRKGNKIQRFFPEIGKAWAKLALAGNFVGL